MLSNSQLIANALWLVSEKGLRFVLGFLVIALVARHLGTSLFGELNFSLAVFSILVVVASSGANRITIRNVTEDRANLASREELVSSMFFFRFFITLGLFALTSIFALILYEATALLFLLVLASLIFQPFEVLDLHQQGLAKVKPVTVIRTGVFIVSSALKVSVVLLDQSPAWIFSLVLFEHALVAALFYVFIGVGEGRKLIRLIHFSPVRLREILNEAWPEILAGLGGILFVRLDQVMLRIMEGAESVGIYSAATRVSEGWYFVPAAIVAASFPKVVQLKAASEKAYLDSISILISIIVALGFIVSLVFVFFAHDIIHLLFGDSYAESGIILQLHCFAAIFIFMGSVSGSWLASERKLIWNLHRNAIGLLVNVVANLILIPIYGGVGAAVATLIAVVTAFYIFDAFTPKLRFIFWMKTYALCTMGMSGIRLAYTYLQSRSKS